MPDTNTQTASNTAAAARHWRDSLAPLQHPTSFSINPFTIGPTFRGWHEHFALEGERWLRERANSGDLYACEKLGLRLIDGDGLETAQEEGLRYLEQPVAADHPVAMTRLAEYLFSLDNTDGTQVRAKQLLERAAERYTFAKIALAMRFILGKGTEADPGRGKATLTELALKGNRLAHIKLAVCSLAGWGGDPNSEEARSWMRRIGALQPEHITGLGFYLYLHSLSLPRCERRAWAEEAAVLFLEAIRQGDRDAELNLVYLLRRGEIAQGVYPTLGVLLAEHLFQNNPLALTNQALRFAKGVQSPVDWNAADRLIAKITNVDGVLGWWFKCSKEGDGEGHLVTGWLCRHQLAVDPGQLTLSARMALARRGDWDVPVWMDEVITEPCQ